MTRFAIHAAFAALLAFGTGCALTNYSLITDNDQVSNGNGSGVVNTNGKALVLLKNFVATEYPDGTDQLFSMVDQKANGDRTITTYNNFSTGDEPVFRDDLYCNPDWQGCAIFTAPDPEEGDVDPFDGALNVNCTGARSLAYLWNTARNYYGECGRAPLALTDRLALANMGRLGTFGGREGLFYSVDRRNTRLHLDNNAGSVVEIPLTGDLSVVAFAGARNHLRVDATNPLLGNVGRRVADFLEDHGTGTTTVTLTYNGISASYEIGGEVFNPTRLREIATRRF